MPTRSAAVEAMTMMLPERCGMKQRLATAWLSANTLVAFKRHDLVPRFERVFLGRRAPGRAGVVDQDIDSAVVLDHRLDQRRHLLGLGQVIDHGQAHRCRASCKIGFGFLEFAGLARADGDLRAHLAQALGDLQSEAARTAGDQRHAPLSSNRSRTPTQATSNRPAAPWPPPMHMVTTTNLAPRRLPSMSA